MLSDFTGADKVYIACGYTDLRKGIDGLASMVQQQFQLDPFTNTLFCALCSLTICVETRNKTRQIPKNLNSMLDSAGAEPA